MSEQPETSHEDEAHTADPGRGQLRRAGRELTLQAALRKRARGVPTYTVPEAAALLSVSAEHLYRLIRADAFPALRVRIGDEQGRYVVPAHAVDELINAVTDAGRRIDLAIDAAGGRQ